MVDALELGGLIVGTIVSIYGGVETNLLTLSIGLATILFTIVLKVGDLQESNRILNAQINTTRELNKMWNEINNLKRNRKGAMNESAIVLLILIIALVLILLAKQGITIFK